MKLKQIRVDGYKNLIDCKLDLGNFNVLVGPNNSGKSNLLEATLMLWPFLIGSDKLRKAMFEGMTPPTRFGSSICHLPDYKNKPMNIGITFETETNENKWVVDYDMKVQCNLEYDEKKENAGFISEVLTAKDPSKTGPARKYINRAGKKLEVDKREHQISLDNSSLSAVKSLYPEGKDLPAELPKFIHELFIAFPNIYSFSPRELRKSMGTEEPIYSSDFDLLLAIDDMKKEEKNYDIFTEAFCDILEFEDIHFEAKEFSIPGKDETKKVKRYRLLSVKRKGGEYSSIEEYSDGTFTVASILAALLSEKQVGPMMTIEEPENFLHPAALEKMLRFLQDNSDKRQVLITTHSPYLLNGVKPSDVSVAVVDENGAAHFEKVENSAELRKYLNKGLMSFGDLLVKNFEGFREG
jgi:predicted ATPase